MKLITLSSVLLLFSFYAHSHETVAELNVRVIEEIELYHNSSYGSNVNLQIWSTVTDYCYISGQQREESTPQRISLESGHIQRRAVVKINTEAAIPLGTHVQYVFEIGDLSVECHEYLSRDLEDIKQHELMEGLQNLLRDYMQFEQVKR